MAEPMSPFFTTRRKGTPQSPPTRTSFTTGCARARWTRGRASKVRPIMMIPAAITSWVGWKLTPATVSWCSSLPLANRTTSIEIPAMYIGMPSHFSQR